MNRGVKINQRHGVLDGLLGEFIGHTVGTAVIQSATGENHRERGALMAPSATTIELRRATEFGADNDEGLV